MILVKYTFIYKNVSNKSNQFEINDMKFFIASQKNFNTSTFSNTNSKYFY